MRMSNHWALLSALFIILSFLHPRTGFAEDQAPATKSIGPFTYQATSTAAKLMPDISVIGTFAAAAFTEEPAGETGHDPARSGLTLQEIELVLQSVVDHYFRADVFIAIHEDAIELEEGYFTTLSLPQGFQIRGGKFLQPFGRQNVKHLETWDFADNPLVNKYIFGAENLNELGIELSYLLPLPFYLNAQFSFSNGENEESFGGERTRDFLYLGRLSTGFDPSENTTVLVGASAATGFNQTGLGTQTTVIGGDFLFKWKPKTHRTLTWQTEYIHRFMDIPGATLSDAGLYSYVDYQFLKRWHGGFRVDYMGISDDSLAKEWRLTPALTFNLTEYSRLRAQYEFDKPNGLDGIHAGILQFQYSMGPHGAHPF